MPFLNSWIPEYPNFSFDNITFKNSFEEKGKNTGDYY